MADVVVIGGANIDIKAKTFEQHRLGTSNPGTISATPGGVARNIAHNLARLGANVSFISAVGEDEFGKTILRATEQAGVDVSKVDVLPMQTGSYIALLDETGELVSAVSDMSIIDGIGPEQIVQRATVFEAAKLIVADCNLKLETLVELASRYGSKLAIEPVSIEKCRKLLKVAAQTPVFLATPNLDQTDALLGTRNIEKASASLLGLGLQNVVIHAGPEGAFIANKDVLEHAAPAQGIKVVDVTGAGDAAMAGLIYGLLQGETLLKAAELGQEIAGRVISTSRSTLE